MSRPTWFLHRAACAAWLCLLVACNDGSPPALDVRAQPVIGGEPAPACAWPSTVRVNGATTCTGTLIHPRIVTTAAHCLDGDGSSATIVFGPGRNVDGGFALTGTCHAGARGESGVNTRNDWGYCVLPEDERLEHVPVTQPLVGCEAERFLKAGAHAWVVGFGDTRGTGPSGKNQVEVEVNQLDKLSPGTIDVGDAEAGACHGDSGGPIYLQLKDGDDDYGFRVFGSTSGPGTRFCDCNCSSTYVNIANHVAQIEQREDIDVTPCTDDDGKWDPGADCNQQLADPQHGTGTWPACEVTLTTKPVASCGPAFEPDAGPPDAGPSDAGTGGTGATGGSAAGGMGGADAGTAGSGVSTPSGGTGGTFVPSSGAGGSGGVAPPTAGSAGTAVPATPAPGFGAAGSLAPPAPAGSFAPAPALTSAQSSNPSGCSCSAVGGRPHEHTRAALALLFTISSCFAAKRRRRVLNRQGGVDA